MSEELPGLALDPKTRNVRRQMIKAREIARRKSVSQRAAWERRRREMREFMEDDPVETDSAGSADYDLDQLPDVMR